MDLDQAIFLGMDLPMLITLPTVIVMFAFAVWFGVSRSGVGIDADEQARRMDEVGSRS